VKIRILVPVFLALAATLSGCGQGTTGRRVKLGTRLATDLDASHTFSSALGWSVTLSRALVATGPLHYYEGTPAFSARAGRGWRRVVSALAPVSTVHAHPGHYVAGAAVGDMLASAAVDLLASPVDLSDGAGVTGRFQSATFSFGAPVTGPAVEALAGRVAVVEGRATKAGQTVFFRLEAALADVERTASNAEVTGCVFDAADVEGPGAVTLTVKPSFWFTFLDFGALAAGTPEAPTTAAPDSAAHVAFALGLTQVGAYHFSFTPAAP
jgi:hypothetical protein